MKRAAHILTQRNKFSVGETIEIMKPDGRNLLLQWKQSMMKKASLWKVHHIHSRNLQWIWRRY